MDKIEGVKAVVVLSGGQDSTTCLHWALSAVGWKPHEVLAVTFDYNQRHAWEIAAARAIAAEAKVGHLVVPLPALGMLSRSALTRDDIEVSATGGLGGLPSTFTPNRNMVFLSLAGAAAVSLGARHLVTGVCQTDSSGYPDCRRDFIDLAQEAIAIGNGLPSAEQKRLGTYVESEDRESRGEPFYIHTPLMHLTKADTVRLARELGAESWRALGMSVTCYHGRRPGCGICPACLLRAKGFAEAGERDPAED